LRRRNECRCSYWAGNGVKALAPGAQIAKGEGGRTGDDTIKVLVEFLRFFEALPAARRAAEIIRLGVRLAVEVTGDCFADLGTSVDAETPQRSGSD
jgi:hypothetical protein